ncbi:hypothetical protein [Granulicella aggregans]|uniref:hypothetical protein n=1 Tax=Granulicella aggregans TaxID=474949 RepID=UPI0021DFB60E|nr:hypothetical protein [Granulicella aggregans]
MFDSREAASAATVSAEAMAEVERVLADDADFSRSTRESIGTNVTKQDADEVFRFIQHYFAGHPTLTSQSEKNGLRSMNKACVELARKAIDLGNIQYASDFLWWLEQRRNEVYGKLMNGTIKNLGVDFGLLRYVNELWDEFVPESDNDPGPSTDDEGGDDDNGGDDDGWSQDDDDDDEGGGKDESEDESPTLTSSRGQAPPPIFDFDDEDEPVEDTEPVSVPGDRFTHERKAFAAALSK